MSILDLPTEIQCDIFLHAHRDSSKSKAPRRHHGHGHQLPVEVVLSHVCSQFRHIAITLPTLWTAFKFDNRLRVPNPTTKLEQYLCRSGTQLLELYFCFSKSDCHYNDDSDGPFQRDFALIETAFGEANRWRRFTLFAEDISGSDFIDRTRFDKIHVPNLEYLALCFSAPPPLRASHGPRDKRRAIFAGGAPRLCDVRINAVIAFHHPPPLSTITTVTIQCKPHERVQFDFNKIHSLLTIPTLINLSIESYNCLRNLRRLPSDLENLPHKRIEMPSLKTLRITDDSGVLGILPCLHAPLLETLVLHRVNLTGLDVDRDISYNEITTFIGLDTVALLDCRHLFGDISREGEDITDTILNKLACRAIHVIISDPRGPSFIVKGSNLLDFKQYAWPRLQRLTLDLSTFVGPVFSSENFEHSLHPLTVRVVEPALNHWREPDGLTTLPEPHKLETMKAGDLMMDDPWPTPGGLFDEGNVGLDFAWGEVLRAKGPDWLRK
ncbi:hypothetical protein M413DRAFT_29963 [Hebeloma cylindrosporum]|uniref:F-box domain-containing protein n=1 Tax=Hebeloma cylindrosporum TaxID=76867 RepID=A0A0C3BQ10_HEBCY|nr:hypothetical protein M413DRAFT_29963 [Hebeloma cylindrosporum h7]